MREARTLIAPLGWAAIFSAALPGRLEARARASGANCNYVECCCQALAVASRRDRRWKYDSNQPNTPTSRNNSCARSRWKVSIIDLRLGESTLCACFGGRSSRARSNPAPAITRECQHNATTKTIPRWRSLPVSLAVADFRFAGRGQVAGPARPGPAEWIWDLGAARVSSRESARMRDERREEWREDSSWRMFGGARVARDRDEFWASEAGREKICERQGASKSSNRIKRDWAS